MLNNEKVDNRLCGYPIIRVGDYINGQIPLLWRCTSCANEWMARPAKIVNHETGCPVCNNATRNNNRRTGTRGFIQKAVMIHGDKYSYDNVMYTNAITKVYITCKVHGDFLQVPDSHLQGYGCSKCHFDNLRDTKDTFVKKARSVHGDTYSYDNFVYSGSRIKGYITCYTHGDFLQKPNTHISKPAGCPQCDHESRRGAYSEEYFTNNQERKDLPGYLYVIKLDDFIKVGITVDVKQRTHAYYGKKKELISVTPMTLHEAYCKEQQILTALQHHRYYPQDMFDGYTECLKYNDEVLLTIKGLLTP